MSRYGIRDCCFLALGFAALSVVLWRYADSGYYCSDAVECTFQALEMKAAGTLFPKSWAATNFAHLQVLPLYLGSMFSSSYVTANRVCVFAMYALLLLSLTVLWRKGLRDRSGLVLALFYAFPTSGYFLQQLFTSVFYTQFAIGIFLVLAAWLWWCFGMRGRSRATRISVLSIALLVTFVTIALTGSRMVAVIGLPIAGGIVWMSVFDSGSSRIDWRRWIGGLLTAVTIGCACVAGNYLYESFVAPAFGVAAQVSCVEGLLHYVYSGDAVAANLGAICEGTMRMFGFPFGYLMTYPYAVLSVLGFAISVCFYILFPILEACSYRRLDGRSRFLVVVAGISVAITLFILAFGHLGKGDEWNMCARYLMLPGLLLLIVGVRYAYRTFMLSPDIRFRLVAAGLALVMLTTAVARWLDVSRDHRSTWTEVLGGLSEEKLDYGYATYENALLPWFYSEGSVKIPHVTLEDGKLSIPGFCAAERWYDVESHDGPTFLMLTEDELRRYAPKGLDKTPLGEPKRKLSFGKYKVLVYDHNIAQDRFGTERGSAKYLWGFQGKWVGNGHAKMEILVPDDLRGKNAEIVLNVNSFGESVEVFSGLELLGHFQFPSCDTDWSEKTVRIPVPARLTAAPRLKLRFEATGVKSPREHGWHKVKMKLGPQVLSADLQATNK